MKIIFIRHGVKKFSNNQCEEGEYQYDSPLKENENRWKNSLMMKLLAEQCDDNKCVGFLPQMVFCSPYIRTRETWDVLYKMFEYSDEFRSTFNNTRLNNFNVDRDIREYLNPKTSQYNERLSPTTIDLCKHGWNDIWTDIYTTKCEFSETEEDLEERVKFFCDKLVMLKEYGYQCVWVISHGFTIQKCVEYLLHPAKSDTFYLDEGDMITVTIEH